MVYELLLSLFGNFVIFDKCIFVSVLYLDSIDLGSLSLEHNFFPRIRCFSSDTLRSMIVADCGFVCDGDGQKDFGNSKVLFYLIRAVLKCFRVVVVTI